MLTAIFSQLIAFWLLTEYLCDRLTNKPIIVLDYFLRSLCTVLQFLYFRMLSQFSDEDACAGLDFERSKCGKLLEKCFDKQFSLEMKDFFIEKAIQFKQWMIFAKKMLENTHAKSVFYFFSPFLLQFCLMNELKWYHIFYEECLHVKR